MSTLVTTNLRHGGAASPNIVLNADGSFNIGSAKVETPVGSAPVYACRAWVNFNGTGTVAIRASGNVSSITDNGTGDYTVNFTTAMPDANYAVVASSGDAQAIIKTADNWGVSGTNPTTTSVRVFNRTGGSTAIDIQHMCAAIFR